MIVDPTLDRVPDSARLLRSLLGLSIVGSSIAMAIEFAAMPRLSRFIATNRLAHDQRTELLVSAAAGAVVAVLVAMGVWAVRRERGPVLLEQTWRLLAPLVLSALLPLLFCAAAWQSKPLEFLALLSLVVVVTMVTTALAFEAAPLATGPVAPLLRWLSGPFALAAKTLERRGVAIAVVCVAAAAYAMAAWLSSANRPQAFAMQAALAGIAALPLFLFAELQLSRPAALLLALGYLLSVQLHAAPVGGFDSIALLPFLLLWLFYATATENRRLIAVLVVALLAVHPDGSPSVAVVGLFLIATGRWRLGAVLFTAGGAWFALGALAILPSATGDYLAALRPLTSDPSHALTALLTEARLVYGLHFLAPLAFLPLRRPALALLSIPGLLFELPANEHTAGYPLISQAAAHWLPLLFAGTVLAVRAIERDRGRAWARAALAALVLGVVAHTYAFGVVAPRSPAPARTPPAAAQSRSSNGPFAVST